MEWAETVVKECKHNEDVAGKTVHDSRKNNLAWEKIKGLRAKAGFLAHKSREEIREWCTVTDRKAVKSLGYDASVSLISVLDIGGLDLNTEHMGGDILTGKGDKGKPELHGDIGELLGIDMTEVDLAKKVDGMLCDDGPPNKKQKTMLLIADKAYNKHTDDESTW